MLNMIFITTYGFQHINITNGSGAPRQAARRYMWLSRLRLSTIIVIYYTFSLM